jgi:hypothetical protein
MRYKVEAIRYKVKCCRLKAGKNAIKQLIFVFVGEGFIPSCKMTTHNGRG